MEKTFHPSKYAGNLKAPLSKSYTQRAIAIATLCKGETKIINPALCDDTNSALEIARRLGAQIKIVENDIFISSNFHATDTTFTAGESGLAVRMFSPILALLDEPVSISGTGTLLKRPVNMIEDPLKMLGVFSESSDGFLPLNIQGPLKGGICVVDGSISSQLLTGLLIALPLAKKDSVIKVTNLQSRPYIDMTLEIISSFGVEVKNENYTDFYIKANQEYKPGSYEIEGDWSNAAFHLVGGAIAGHLEMSGLNPNSKQADVAILEVLKSAGVKLQVFENKIILGKSDLRAFNFDATHCPDLFPPLAILAAACKGQSRIKGVKRLIHKESNRALVLQTELGKIGINIELKDDLMFIHGGTITGGKINSNNDHRIAMAGAIASLVSINPITIQQAEAVNKSYPKFYTDYESLRIPAP